MLHLQTPEAAPTIPFSTRDLSVLAYTNGFTLWLYKAPSVYDVFIPGYFNEACDMMRAGDHMHVAAPDGGALLSVASAAGEVVRIAGNAILFDRIVLT